MKDEQFRCSNVAEINSYPSQAIQNLKKCNEVGQMRLIKSIVILLFIFALYNVFCVHDDPVGAQSGAAPQIQATQHNVSYTTTCSIIDVEDRGANASVWLAGDVVKYQLTLTNTGDTDITGICVIDKWNGLKVPVDPYDFDGILSPNETWVYLGTKEITDEEMKLYKTNGIITDTIEVKSDNADIKLQNISVTIDANDHHKILLEREITYSDLYLISGNCVTIMVGGDGHTIQMARSKYTKDPTYAKLTEFLKEDTTDKHKYIDNAFVCADYAENLQHNATKRGYTCGFVAITFADGDKHACNVFNTTDKGLVYVDCTNVNGPRDSDCVVDVAQGKAYCPELLFSNNWYIDKKGAVQSFRVFW